MSTLSTNYSRLLDTSPPGILVNLWLRNIQEEQQICSDLNCSQKTKFRKHKVQKRITDLDAHPVYKIQQTARHQSSLHTYGWGKKNFLELEATEVHKNADHTAEHLRKVYLPATSTGRKHIFNLETCLGQYSYFLQRKTVKVWDIPYSN